MEYRPFLPKEERASLFPIFPCFGENTGLFFLFAQKPFPLEYQELSCSSDSPFPREQEIHFFHVVVRSVRQEKTDCIGGKAKTSVRVLHLSRIKLNKSFERNCCAKFQRGLLALGSERRTGARVAPGRPVGLARAMSPKPCSRRLC